MFQFFGRSIRRGGFWSSIQHTVAGKIFLGMASIILIGGILTAVFVSLRIARDKAEGEISFLFHL